MSHDWKNIQVDFFPKTCKSCLSSWTDASDDAMDAPVDGRVKSADGLAARGDGSPVAGKQSEALEDVPSLMRQSPPQQRASALREGIGSADGVLQVSVAAAAAVGLKLVTNNVSTPAASALVALAPGVRAGGDRKRCSSDALLSTGVGSSDDYRRLRQRNVTTPSAGDTVLDDQAEEQVALTVSMLSGHTFKVFARPGATVADVAHMLRHQKDVPRLANRVLRLLSGGDDVSELEAVGNAPSRLSLVVMPERHVAGMAFHRLPQSCDSFMQAVVASFAREVPMAAELAQEPISAMRALLVSRAYAAGEETQQIWDGLLPSGRRAHSWWQAVDAMGRPEVPTQAAFMRLLAEVLQVGLQLVLDDDSVVSLATGVGPTLVLRFEQGQGEFHPYLHRDGAGGDLARRIGADGAIAYDSEVHGALRQTLPPAMLKFGVCVFVADDRELYCDVTGSETARDLIFRLLPDVDGIEGWSLWDDSHRLADGVPLFEQGIDHGDQLYLQFTPAAAGDLRGTSISTGIAGKVDGEASNGPVGVSATSSIDMPMTEDDRQIPAK